MEMEKDGEFKINSDDLGPAFYSSSMKPLTDKPIEIDFNANLNNYSESEFADQLEGQETDLNFSSVARVLDNLAAYIKNGRTNTDKLQQHYRLAIVEQIMDERGEAEILTMMEKNPNLSYESASNLVDWGRLRQDAETEIKSSEALHGPDQCAGGDPSNIHSIGSSSVNSSIGKQWDWGRAEKLYQEIKAASAGMSREEMEQTRLNVRLKYTVKSNT